MLDPNRTIVVVAVVLAIAVCVWAIQHIVRDLLRFNAITRGLYERGYDPFNEFADCEEDDAPKGNVTNYVTLPVTRGQSLTVTRGQSLTVTVGPTAMQAGKALSEIFRPRCSEHANEGPHIIEVSSEVFATAVTYMEICKTHGTESIEATAFAESHREPEFQQVVAAVKKKDGRSVLLVLRAAVAAAENESKLDPDGPASFRAGSSPND